jgi:3-phenylpropionate/cinnamic acid dioxygenase small subunit
MISDSEIENLLYREARLMDEHRYEEWLSLWTSDAIYWVPCGHEDTDPLTQVSIIYDNRAKMGDRVARLMSGSVMAQDPKPRMRRVISNIEVEHKGDDQAIVDSNFILIQARNSKQLIWCGRSAHSIRREGEALKIARKKVLLVNSEQEMPVLQFLI